MVTANFHTNDFGMKASQMNHVPAIAPDMNSKQISEIGTHVSAEYLMMQVQIYLAQDFSDQVMAAGKQISFLSDLKKEMRSHIGSVQEFMSKNSNSSRKDGKKYFEASAAELSRLYANFTRPEYELSSVESGELNANWKSLTFEDSGQKHSIDEEYSPVQDGQMNVTEWCGFFRQVDELGKNDSASACTLAQKAGSDNTALPFYFGNTNNTCDDGTPKFAVYEESLQKMLDQLNTVMDDINHDAEQLSSKLNLLTAQRKAALDGAVQIRQKIDEIKTNTAGKIDR